MDVKPGYKQTDVGVVPEDWVIKPLSEMFNFSGGLSASRAQLGFTGHCYLHYGDIHTSAKFYVDVENQYNDLPKLDVKLGDVSRRSLLFDGDVVFVDASEDDEGTSKHQVVRNRRNIPFISGLHTIVAKSKTSDLVNAYKEHCFQTQSIKKQFLFYSVGTKVSGISKTNIAKILLPIPPQLEQEAIAGVLSDADAYIESLEQLITKKRQVKHGTMQELLTGKKRLPGFSGEWEIKKIGEIAHTTAGGTPSTSTTSYWGGDIRWMNSGELHLKMVYEVEGRITEEGLRNSSTKIIPPKCVLIGLAGQGKTRGTVAMNMVELCTNQSIAAILPSKSHVPEYLYCNLDNRYEELREVSSGEGGRGGLNLTLINKLDLPLPSIPEQTAIAGVMGDMSAEITALEAKLDKARQIKQGMMQELLTGRIRLI
jgi:type I restriction enzyme S subunit